MSSETGFEQGLGKLSLLNATTRPGHHAWLLLHSAVRSHTGTWPAGKEAGDTSSQREECTGRELVGPTAQNSCKLTDGTALSANYQQSSRHLVFQPARGLGCNSLVIVLVRIAIRSLSLTEHALSSH